MSDDTAPLHPDPKAPDVSVCFPGRKYGVTDLGADVVTFVSHATQQRLQTLLEKVSQVAQQKSYPIKVCLQHYPRDL